MSTTYRFSRDPPAACRTCRTCQRREALLDTGVRDSLLRAGTATASSSSASSGCAPSAASRLMPAFARDDSFSSYEGSHTPDSVDRSAFDVPRVGVTHPTGRLAVRCETRSRVVAVVDLKSRSSRRLAEPHRSVAARIRTGLNDIFGVLRRARVYQHPSWVIRSRSRGRSVLRLMTPGMCTIEQLLVNDSGRRIVQPLMAVRSPRAVCSVEQTCRIRLAILVASCPLPGPSRNPCAADGACHRRAPDETSVSS